MEWGEVQIFSYKMNRSEYLIYNMVTRVDYRGHTRT